ncbi:hypothetical protein ACFXJ8_02130 [Nonomuraea sp. NPDC059194]|uniref:hypothetical protein n=1 Tax=Nonomuraea sp. NPDC059194 TaxID=3346764 RepID=UPI00369F92B5
MAGASVVEDGHTFMPAAAAVKACGGCQVSACSGSVCHAAGDGVHDPDCWTGAA